MTKKEMIMEMLPKGWKIGKREKASMDRAEEVYKYYLKTDKTEKDKAFCSSVL